MREQKFWSMWKLKFPQSYPIGHELKWIYKNRWFRIHSLPGSKRYAQNQVEYQMIFDRQNQIIADLAGENGRIVLLSGLYKVRITDNNYKKVSKFGKFEKVDTLELHKIRPEENETELYFDIYIKAV